MADDIGFIVEQLRSQVTPNWQELQQPETYNKFSARSCISHKPGTQAFLAGFDNLDPWLTRLKTEFESEGTIWKESEIVAELAAAAEEAEANEEEVEPEIKSNTTQAAIDHEVDGYAQTIQGYLGRIERTSYSTDQDKATATACSSCPKVPERLRRPKK